MRRRSSHHAAANPPAIAIGMAPEEAPLPALLQPRLRGAVCVTASAPEVVGTSGSGGGGGQYSLGKQYRHPLDTVEPWQQKSCGHSLDHSHRVLHRLAAASGASV